MTVKRGTTNRNARGSSKDRRRRREYLVEHYRADVDLLVITWTDGTTTEAESSEITPEELLTFGGVVEVTAVAACRCYRCGTLLTVETVSPDRRKPGCEGGTYARDNIRPACEPCQSSTGGTLGAERRAARRNLEAVAS